MIQIKDYFKHMAELGHTPTPEIQANAFKLLSYVNLFLDYLMDHEINHDYPIVVNSGWRTPEYNASIGGAPHSHHCTGDAIDLRGVEVINICMKRPDYLMKFKLYAESPLRTKTWTHLQTIKPPSGYLVFMP